MRMRIMMMVVRQLAKGVEFPSLKVPDIGWDMSSGIAE